MASVCLNCRGQNKTTVELNCEHELCLECAEKIKIAEGTGPLDSKFKICCPKCRKNTITLNIQNLVSKNTEKMLFVHLESSELSEAQLEQNQISESRLRKMSYTERRSSVCADRKTPDIDRVERKSRGHDSRSNNRSRQGQNLDIKCSIHKQPLMFYCDQEAIVMCMQCMYKHMKEQKNHNVSSITDALPSIAKHNLDFKGEAKARIEDLDRNINICKGNKSRIEQAYEIHNQMISQQFLELQNLVKKKQEQSKQYLQRVFKKKEEEISQQVNQLNYIKSCFKQHYQFTLDNSSSQIYFFNAFNLLKSAINKYTLSYKQIKKQEFFCFDKFVSIEDFSHLLEKLFKPKEVGRESKNTYRKDEGTNNGPSRSSERGGGTKIKQQFYEEAKKRLQKLNKMQNQHGNGMKKKNTKEEYLNNFFIEEMGRQLENSYNHRNQGSTVATYRKSSASQYVQRKVGGKTLTPSRMTPTPSHPKTKKK